MFMPACTFVTTSKLMEQSMHAGTHDSHANATKKDGKQNERRVKDNKDLKEAWETTWPDIASGTLSQSATGAFNLPKSTMRTCHA